MRSFRIFRQNLVGYKNDWIYVKPVAKLIYSFRIVMCEKAHNCRFILKYRFYSKLLPVWIDYLIDNLIIHIILKMRLNWGRLTDDSPLLLPSSSITIFFLKRKLLYTNACYSFYSNIKTIFYIALMHDCNPSDQFSDDC